MSGAGLKTVTTPAATCPTCRATITRASSVEGAHPAPGDITVCLYCAAACTFTPTLGLRTATAADLGELTAAARATLRQYRQTVLAMIGRH